MILVLPSTTPDTAVGVGCAELPKSAPVWDSRAKGPKAELRCFGGRLAPAERSCRNPRSHGRQGVSAIKANRAAKCCIPYLSPEENRKSGEEKPPCSYTSRSSALGCVLPLLIPDNEENGEFSTVLHNLRSSQAAVVLAYTNLLITSTFMCTIACHWLEKAPQKPKLSQHLHRDLHQSSTKITCSVNCMDF